MPKLDHLTPARLTVAIKNLVDSYDLPETNAEVSTQKHMRDLLLGKTIASLGKSLVDPATKELRLQHEPKLKTAGDFKLDTIGNLELSAKVTKPRAQFDKDKYVKLVAKKYNLDELELRAMLSKAESKTAAPVSLTVTVTN